jgi:predicted dehydrogenase
MAKHVQPRREFIRHAFLAASLPFIGGSVCSRRPLRPGRPLGFALVGLGNLSTNQIAPALERTTNCRLAGIVTGSPGKVARWQQRFGIPDRSVYSYETMERMSENADIDVVYVVTPNALHAEHTIRAARAGKHVLCEKPMEVSAERCQAMIDACRTAGRQLAIGYRCQFEPHHLECVRLARERVLGGVRRVQASFGFPIGNPSQWRLDRSLSGGGPLMDVGIYALQTARMLAGEEPVSVTALETRSNPPKFRSTEEAMEFTLEFAGGLSAQCSTSYTGSMNTFTAFAEHGSFGMSPAYNYGGNRGWRSDGVPLSFRQVDQFAAELDDFATCITTGRRTRVPGEEGLRDVRILMATYESARTGRTVRLEP